MMATKSSFSPEACAVLHNKLLEKIASHSPTASLEQTFVERVAQKLPHFTLIPNIENTPVYRFLSLIKTFTAGSNLSLVTPFALQPDPDFLLLGPGSTSAHVDINGYPTVIRLYAGCWGVSLQGLLLDIQTGLAHWDTSASLQPKDQWPPLQEILQAWNDEWESGKFYWDSGAKMRSWTEYDLKRSLGEWESLLQIIESKRPGNNSGTKYAHGLSPRLLTQFSITSFAYEFLSRARIPDFKYIAPGISAFTPETFLRAYSSEELDSRRLAWISEADPDEYPCLLFPSDDTVPRPSRDAKFDKDWGFGKFTVSRRAGLYIDTDGTFGDGVQFVDPQGRISTFEISTNPFGPCQSPRLEEVLRTWKQLIQDDVWDINEEGVSGGAQWYEDQASSSTFKKLQLPSTASSSVHRHA
jgi:hypothetical protein